MKGGARRAVPLLRQGIAAETNIVHIQN